LRRPRCCTCGSTCFCTPPHGIWPKPDWPGAAGRVSALGSQ
jgi:hypothetical protein